ncbi:Creatine kinase [Aix galericulata]|nr:Creatine kinase [Aix galericulata]
MGRRLAPYIKGARQERRGSSSARAAVGCGAGRGGPCFGCGALVTAVGSAMPFSNSHNLLKMKHSATDEFPDLSAHNNHMAKVLTLDLYKKLRDKQTPSGFTLDDVIQTGVDNPAISKWPN